MDHLEYLLPLFWLIVYVFALFVYLPSNTYCVGRTRRRLCEITDEKCSEKHFRATTHHVGFLY